MTRHTDGHAQVERANRQARAVQLRAQGAGYRQIATALHCSASTAHQLVVDALAVIPAESVAQLRSIEGTRLDTITHALMPGVEAGDAAACSVAVRVSARRSALLGLDAPVRVEVEDVTVNLHAAMIPERLRPAGATGYLEWNMTRGELVDPPPPGMIAEPWKPEIVEADG